MTARIKNLRHPIHTEINGEHCTLLPIGYVAHALGRSVWTVKYWTKLGLLPRAPFAQRRDTPNTRRRLYPQPFVQSLAEIANRGYLGTRLERSEWARFRRDVHLAFEKTVVPLLIRGVTDETPTSAAQGQ